MKDKLIAAKNFVVKHKVAIASSAVAVAATALVIRNQREVNEFLEEKGLLEEFYSQEA